MWVRTSWTFGELSGSVRFIFIEEYQELEERKKMEQKEKERQEQILKEQKQQMGETQSDKQGETEMLVDYLALLPGNWEKPLYM